MYNIKVFILLFALAYVNANPVTSDPDNQTEIDEVLLISKGVIGFIPIVVDESTKPESTKTESAKPESVKPESAQPESAGPESEKSEHKVAKRSAFRGDNPSNDLLASYEGANYENGLTGLERRIKTLPTWVG